MMSLLSIKKNKGYTLLFAVLVSALVLGVGVSILNIARKELILNSSARQSQYSFYAADTGYECAVYWDGQGYFSSSTFPVVNSGGNELIACGTNASNVISSSTVVQTTISTNTNYSYSFAVPLSGQSCAQVLVTKTFGTIAGVANPGISTTITSLGYNVGWNSAASNCSGVSPTKVERALYITY